MKPKSTNNANHQAREGLRPCDSVGLTGGQPGSDSPLDEDTQWSIERYLLSAADLPDERQLDERQLLPDGCRNSFEARMLDDPEFALRVAATVKDLQVMGTAMRCESVPGDIEAPGREQSKSSNWPWVAIPVLAATLLVAASVSWQRFALQSRTGSEFVQSEILPDLASGWLALLPDDESDWEFGLMDDSENASFVLSDPYDLRGVTRESADGGLLVDEMSPEDLPSGLNAGGLNAGGLNAGGLNAGGLDADAYSAAEALESGVDEDWLFEVAAGFLTEGHSSDSSG